MSRSETALMVRAGLCIRVETALYSGFGKVAVKTDLANLDVKKALNRKPKWRAERTTIGCASGPETIETRHSYGVIFDGDRSIPQSDAVHHYGLSGEAAEDEDYKIHLKV